MAARTLTTMLIAIGCCLNVASADFTGILWEDDTFALDGVTPLTEILGYSGERVINVYATFDNPNDQCVAVVGTGANPFQVQTTNGSGFINPTESVGLIFDTPPNAGFLPIFPALNFDSFYTIGAKLEDQGSGLSAIPGTPGPNTDPWPLAPSTSMGWFVPPSDASGADGFNIDDLITVLVNWGPCPGGCPGDHNGDEIVDAADIVLVLIGWSSGAPAPDSLAGDDGRVLLMRLTVNPGIDITGSFGIVTIIGGVGTEADISLSTAGPGGCCLPDLSCVDGIDLKVCDAMGGDFIGTGELCSATSCNGACCFDADAGLKDCVIVSEKDCFALPGGVFLGSATDCPTQLVLMPIHTATQWTHVISPVSLCPNNLIEEAVGGCIDGPIKIDPWMTADDGNSCEDFSSPDACPIPAGFFGPGSDPFDGLICFDGQPIGPIDVAGLGVQDFGDADTLVARANDPFDRCDLPSPTQQTVDIEIVALNLVSAAPMVVTFNGGQDPEEWDVQVQLSDTAAQPGGQLNATKEHCNGGTFDSVLAACPKFVFTKVSDPGVVIELDFCNNCNPAGIVMDASGESWVHDADAGLGLENPICSEFHPGLQERNQKLDCDCNTNGVRDKCDIENGFIDCNDNGVPDVCEPQGSCTSDTDCNGSVDVDDLVNVILNWDCKGTQSPCTGDVNQSGGVDVDDLVQIILDWGPC